MKMCSTPSTAPVPAHEPALVTASRALLTNAECEHTMYTWTATERSFSTKHAPHRFVEAAIAEKRDTLPALGSHHA